MYEVSRCHEETRDITLMPGCVGTDDECTVDPPCADQAQLNNWLRGKKLAFKVINNHANLAHGETDKLV